MHKLVHVRAGVPLGLALEALRRHKLRSALTALGIVVGVACIVTMVGIGEGSKGAIQRNISALGSNFLVVYPGIATSAGARIFTGQSTLTEDDVAAVREECASAAFVTPDVRTAAQLVQGESNWGTRVEGVGVDWPCVRSWDVKAGAFFGEPEVRSAARVCLVGATVAEQLFGSADPVGETIRMKNIPFRVVGVLEAKGGNLMGQDQDDVVVAPYTTVMRLLKRTIKIDAVLVSAISPDAIDQAQAEIEALLRQRHRIPDGQDSDFLIRSQQEIAQVAEQTSGTLSMLLATLASIALLVAGVGIANVMLVSVTERIREIGLRLAVGARRRDILAQFLIEALGLSVAGGAVGVVVGLCASRILAAAAGWPIAFSSAAIARAFAVAVTVGLVFGLYPAWKASRFRPIEALRFE
jgi:putative ABC transport system permease protein